jgi:hypothetical protein
MAQPPGRGTLLHTDPTSPTGMPLGSPGPQPVSGSATRAVVPALCLGGWLPAGTVNLMGCGRNDARDEAGNTDGYARAATPVTAAQVWKAWVRAARYWLAGR